MDKRRKAELLDQIAQAEQILKKARDVNSHTPPVIDAVEKLAMVLYEVITEMGPSAHAEAVEHLAPSGQGDGSGH